MPDRLTRRRLLATLGATTSGVAGCTSTSSQQSALSTENTDELFVSPEGSDFNPGTSTAPLKHIQAALEFAGPGTTVRLAPGEYRESVLTQTDGEPDAPIKITGPPEAVIRPPPGSHDCMYIKHHHTHVTGITLDGLTEPEKRLEDHEAYADNIVWITSVDRALDGVEYLRGVVFEPSRIGNTAKAMVQTARVRNASIGNFEVIGPAGVRYDDRVENTEVGHVGEIVYVGSPEPDRGVFKYGYTTVDRTQNVRIHHIDNSEGYRHAEFADIKLGCTDITVEYCTSRNSGHSSEKAPWPMVNLGGNDCTIRWNDFASGPTGFQVASWVPTGDIDGTEWAKNNAIYGNRLADFSDQVFRFPDSGDSVSLGSEAQRILCGNTIEGPNAADYDYASGACSADVPTTKTIGHLGGESPYSN